MTGYIKDSAWDYEKEVRLKTEFDNIVGFERVAIAIPDELLNKMTISAGPLFEGNLAAEIYQEIHRQFLTEKSIFTGKLHIKSACVNCSYKKASR